jgi:hypothetical protein
MNITPLTWSGLPKELGGGRGPVIENPIDQGLPALQGETITAGGQDYKVLRVQRLYRDPKGKKPSARIILVVRE